MSNALVKVSNGLLEPELWHVPETHMFVPETYMCVLETYIYMYASETYICVPETYSRGSRQSAYPVFYSVVGRKAS